MELEEYVAQVQTQLAASAALGDEQTHRIAEALAVAAGPAVRLAIMTALSRSADELTAALLDVPGAPTVSARLDGEELRIEVSSAGPESSAHPPRTDEGEATARISLRLSEGLKSEVDSAAAAAGISVNTWLVRAAAAALSAAGAAPRNTHAGSGVHHITGWING